MVQIPPPAAPVPAAAGSEGSFNARHLASPKRGTRIAVRTRPEAARDAVDTWLRERDARQRRLQLAIENIRAAVDNIEMLEMQLW